jgi:hypothetical protein
VGRSLQPLLAWRVPRTGVNKRGASTDAPLARGSKRQLAACCRPYSRLRATAFHPLRLGASPGRAIRSFSPSGPSGNGGTDDALQVPALPRRTAPRPAKLITPSTSSQGDDPHRRRTQVEPSGRNRRQPVANANPKESLRSPDNRSQPSAIDHLLRVSGGGRRFESVRGLCKSAAEGTSLIPGPPPDGLNRADLLCVARLL